MIHITTRIERPSSSLLDRLGKLGAATLHEASGRKGAVDPAIKPVARGLRLCGPAFTVQCAPRDNLMFHKALEKAQPGDVLVASVGGYREAGDFGGLAIDGCIRDSADIVDMIGTPTSAARAAASASASSAAARSTMAW